MDTIQLKDFIKFKYNIGDVLEGPLNVFYVQEQIIIERVVPIPIDYGTHTVQGSDWAYVPEYILDNPILNQRFRYGEKDIDRMIEAGAKLHRRKVPSTPTCET